MTIDYAQRLRQKPSRPKRRHAHYKDHTKSNYTVNVQNLATNQKLGLALRVVVIGVIGLVALTWIKNWQNMTPTRSQASHQASKALSQREDHYQFYNILPHLQLKTPNIKQIESFEDYAQKFNYAFQVATYKNKEDANYILERLALLGLEGHVEPVNAKGKQWWRVRLGPYHELEETETVEKILRDNHLEYLLFKSKKASR